MINIAHKRHVFFIVSMPDFTFIGAPLEPTAVVQFIFLYSFKWFKFVIMQVYYLKCSGRLGRIRNQHGRYHFPLDMLTDLCLGLSRLIPEFCPNILVTTHYYYLLFIIICLLLLYYLFKWPN
jgi:hypothetical protein